MSPRARKALYAILCLALALRVAYTFEAQANPMHLAPLMDARYHLDWARALLAGGQHHAGVFFRAPLYPWFLAAGLLLTKGSLLAVYLAQALLGVSATYLTFDLARTAFPRAGTRGPLIAALIVATNWVLIYFDAEILLPTLAIPLQLLALKLSLNLSTDTSTRSTLLCGLAWGTAALVRPNCLLFVALLVAWKLLSRPRKPALALILACGTLLPILPITAYNALQGDTVLISSQAGLNLWIGNNPHADGSTAVVPGTRPDWWGGHIDALHQAEEAEGRSLLPSEVSQHYARRALTWAAQHPGDWLALTAHKARLLLGHRELGNNADIDYFAHRFSRTMRALPPSFAPLLALGLAGMLLGWRRRELAPELPAFLLVYAASILLFFICARYRAPLLPILAIGAGHAIAWSLASLRAGRYAAPLRLGLFAATILTLSLWPTSAAVHDEAPGRWQLGVSALQAGDPRAAIVHFEATLALQPNYYYASRDLGRAHLDLGDLDSASAALRHGLSLRPADPWLADLLADVHFEARRPDALESLGKDLLQAHPVHATAHYHIARAHLLRGQEQVALASAEQGLTLDPAHFQCLFLSARILHAQGQTETACAQLQTATRTARSLHDDSLLRMARDESERLGCPTLERDG